MSTGKSCVFNFHIGDGYCDDEANNPKCSFDGGDCCMPTEVMNNTKCHHCQCYGAKILGLYFFKTLLKSSETWKSANSIIWVWNGVNYDFS